MEGLVASGVRYVVVVAAGTALQMGAGPADNGQGTDVDSRGGLVVVAA